MAPTLVHGTTTTTQMVTDVEIDHFEAHPMDHPFWRCMLYPGGVRNHIRLRWAQRPSLRGRLRRQAPTP
jgi:hypothetical protein